jgi:DNA-binding MarR family transcriptional regulator
MSRTPAALKIAKAFYEPAGYCVDESVGWLMKRALMSIAQAADRRLEPKGITHAQWAALFMLQRCRASTVAELARETQSDPGAMTRLLDRLEAKGFCRRQRSTDDRRVVRIELTPEGDLAAQEVPIVLSDVLNEHLKGFSSAEWSQLKDMLRRMVANGCDAEKENGS